MMIASHQWRKPWLSTHRTGLLLLDDRRVRVNSAGDGRAVMKIDFTTYPKESWKEEL